MDKILLIDGYSIVNRAFYGLPDLTNSKGMHTNALLGFLNIMFKVIEEEQPTHLCVAFDVKAPTFRHKMFEAYKGTRKPMAEELRQQVPLMKEMLTAMGIKKGDKVLLVLKRSYYFWFIILGLHKIGAVVVQATNMLKANDYVYRCNAA